MWNHCNMLFLCAWVEGEQTLHSLANALLFYRNALIKPEELPPPKPSSSSTSSDVEGLLSLIDDDVLLTCNTQVTSDVTSHHEPSNTSESSPAPSLPETSVPVTNSQPSRFPDLLPLGDITVTLQDVKPS